jgi:hypothetical protein
VYEEIPEWEEFVAFMLEITEAESAADLLMYNVG